MQSIERSHNAAVAPDEVPYEFIKLLPQESLQYLLNTLNDIWINGEFLKIWKQSKVIPISKPNKNDKTPQNYKLPYEYDNRTHNGYETHIQNELPLCDNRTYNGYETHIPNELSLGDNGTYN